MLDILQKIHYNNNMTNRAYKYRIYPNKEQRQILEKHFGCARFVYNYYLQQRISSYAETGNGLSFYDTERSLTQLKKQEDHIWLQEVNSQSLQFSLRNLDVAYHNFFNKKSKFPNFKKKSNRQSFTIPQHFTIIGSKLNIPKCKGIRIKLHRPVGGTMRFITITKTPTGKYYASIICLVDIPEPTYTGNAIGIDFGLKTFVTTSDNIKVSPPKYLRKSENKLMQLSKRLSKKVKGSSNRNKSRKKLAKLYEKVSNQREDFLHKLSAKLVNDNQVIYIEDLNIRGMNQNHSLAKSISDSSWTAFVNMLQYKGTWYGCKVEKIDRYFPTSKRCHKCGYINNFLTLSDRTWRCPKCSTHLDRDLNAAINILIFGRAGTAQTSNACGEATLPVSGTDIDNTSLKQEALTLR